MASFCRSTSIVALLLLACVSLALAQGAQPVAPLAPVVSQEALAASFKVLVAAFVLALLLESAFALLFNWRVFLAFFVGKAIRTPIMFASALVVVRIFNFDLIASMFNAYDPQTVKTAVADGWYTSIFTAMILAGGSAGVNRIMVALGFRSAARAQEITEELAANEAWISIKVVRKQSKTPVSAVVAVTEDPTRQADPPMIVGMVGRNKTSLANLFFPSINRVPSSGGRKVGTESCYFISVQDPASGKLYDVSGKEIATYRDGTPLRFAPRAFVDFVVGLP